MGENNIKQSRNAKKPKKLKDQHGHSVSINIKSLSCQPRSDSPSVLYGYGVALVLTTLPMFRG